MKVYISGPMRGIRGCNFALFDLVRDILEYNGHTVMSPADNDRAWGFDGTESPDCTDSPGFPFREAITKDMTWIGTEADAIVLLPGWEDSMGALLEKHFAEFLGLTVGYALAEDGVNLIDWDNGLTENDLANV